MSHHLVVGAGPVGRAVARHLVARGEDVTLASRSGTGPLVEGARRVAVDATSAAQLGELADGAAVLYNCLNPAGYHLWEKEWPPLHEALLAAAASSGAVLATVGNLYPYGRVTDPMTGSTPEAPAEHKGELRARMTAEAMAAHREGRLRAVEVRASDYIGASVGQNGHATRNIDRIRAGKSVQVVGATDEPHSWTFVDDVAAAVVAAAADPALHGRTWLVPTNPPRTQRELTGDLAAAAGVGVPKVSAMPTWLLVVVGWFVPQMREIRKIDHQFTAPYVVDSSEAEAALGFGPTPWDEVLRATLAPERTADPRPAEH
ncbi:NAD-dependent epimerase/dehydratase family protein [Georgenia sp. Z1344]|uniref:NAD-dependent epimerase/dehydratase family protein n=1 Tax=Georgenia sp. Z1344 TaxID=3416706 RepID=UPI003CEBED7D